ncbi:eCIS core domain-containing protein [Nannocystaceae bacterium ST9]
MKTSANAERTAQRGPKPSTDTRPASAGAIVDGRPEAHAQRQLQAKIAASSRGFQPSQRSAAHGISGAGGSLPHRDAIARSFHPHDVSSIIAHTDRRAALATHVMGAQAFATGNHVAFAKPPSLHTAAHEAAHVIQQRAGVHLKAGVGEVGDAHEQHADAVADLVVQGRSAATLLDRYAGSATPPSPGAAIQMVVGKGLKTPTIVVNPQGHLCKIINETATGYRVANTSSQPAKVEAYTYDQLSPPQTIDKLPPSFLVDEFAKAKGKHPFERLRIATSIIDDLFAKAASTVIPVIPFVESFSWMALGSYGRQEMCPFSDVELGVVYLVKPEHRNSADHGAIKVALAKMGGSVLAALRDIAPFVTLDSEGNYPSGKGGGSLMGDASLLPRSIAVASARESMDARHTMLLDARYVPVKVQGAGPDAFAVFRKSMFDTMASPVASASASASSSSGSGGSGGSGERQSDVNARHLATLAAQTIRDGVADIKKTNRFVNVKKNFRQPLDWALLALCMKHGLFDAVGFEQRLVALERAGALSHSLVGHIFGLYELIFTTRIDLHLLHGSELDVIERDPTSKDKGGFEDPDIKKIASYEPGPKVAHAMVATYLDIAAELLPLVEALLEPPAPVRVIPVLHSEPQLDPRVNETVGRLSTARLFADRASARDQPYFH